MNRQPRKVSNEEPHQKLDPREVKARSTAQQSGKGGDIDSSFLDDYFDDSERAGSEYRRTQFENSKYNPDEYVTYDDSYDDVYRYYKRPSEVSGGRRVVGKILCYLQAAASALVIYLLFKLNILPVNTMIIISAIIVILWLLVFISQRRIMKRAQAAGMIGAAFISIILALVAFYIGKTDSMLETVTGRTYDIRIYDVVVRGDDPAEALADTRSYTFGIQPTFEGEDLKSIIGDIEEKIGSEIETVDMSSSLAQARALLEGDVDAIIYNDSFNSTIVEQYEDFEQQTRILDTFTVKTESEVKSVDVDVESEAFLVFISGNDSIGSISLTGRSDVNIIAGVNADTREILLLTIPRDYYVEFPGITTAGSRDKLTHAGIYGMDELLATVENLIGHEINYYIRLNFSSMINIVDAMGGVTIDNAQEFTSIDGLYYPQGVQEMDGLFALNYVRERYAFEDGDFARGRHQLQMIQAMMDKLISANTLTNYNALADAIASFAATNIPKSDITDLVKMQISENPQWHVVNYQYLGEVMFQPCQSANGAYLAVDMPYVESVENAALLIDQLFTGQPLSEDLQLEDHGQLTYVMTPVS